MTPTSTPTPIPTRPTRLHPYVRHARFPREDRCEDVGVGVASDCVSTGGNAIASVRPSVCLLVCFHSNF